MTNAILLQATMYALLAIGILIGICAITAELRDDDTSDN